jgi:citrate lyase alpha subunit
VNPLPSLAIVRTGSDAIISWPAWASGFNLQSSTNGASSSWIDVANAPQTSGDNLTVTLGLSGETKFFRLRHP